MTVLARGKRGLVVEADLRHLHIANDATYYFPLTVAKEDLSDLIDTLREARTVLAISALEDEE